MELSLTARQWATVDASMDNAAWAERASGGDDGPVRAIRQAGRDQVPWVGPEKQWPADEEAMTISLTPDQWEFVVRCLERDAPSYEELGDGTSLALGRDAECAIRAQLP